MQDPAIPECSNAIEMIAAMHSPGHARTTPLAPRPKLCQQVRFSQTSKRKKCAIEPSDLSENKRQAPVQPNPVAPLLPSVYPPNAPLYPPFTPPRRTRSSGTENELTPFPGPLSVITPSFTRSRSSQMLKFRAVTHPVHAVTGSMNRWPIRYLPLFVAPGPFPESRAALNPFMPLWRCPGSGRLREEREARGERMSYRLPAKILQGHDMKVRSAFGPRLGLVQSAIQPGQLSVQRNGDARQIASHKALTCF